MSTLFSLAYSIFISSATSGCKTIGQKHVTRQKYASYFDKLLCPGVSKDTVEKYLGVGGEFPYAGDHKGGWKTKATKPKYTGSYCLIFDCLTKEWVSVIRIIYKNGKVVKYTQGAIYY